MKNPSIVVAALGVILLSACKKQETQSPVLAQVGDAVLTLDDLRESFPAEFEQLIRREQYLDFIKRWVDDEAAYQQARKANLEADPVVARRLEKVKRRMLIEEFLARENAGDVFEPDEMAMNQYYEMHKEDFRRKVPEYKYAYIRAQTNKQAADLRFKAQRTDFLAVAAASSLDPAPESYASIAFKKVSEMPPCLASEIDKVGIGGVALPVACSDGFYVVKVLEKQDAGSLIPFSEAKEEISGILIMERKDKLLENRIAKYKEGLAISYNLENVPGLAEKADTAPSVSRPAPSVAATPAASEPPKHAPPAHSAPRPAPKPAAVPPAANANLPREPWEEDPAQTAPARPASPRKPARPTVPARMASDTSAAPAADAAVPDHKPENPENENAPESNPAP